MNNERMKALREIQERIGSLAEPPLRGGEWNGVRVMGCGERLVDIGIAIGISITVSLWVAPKVARLTVRQAERDFLRRRAASVGQPAGVLLCGREAGRDQGGDERRDERRANGVEMREEPAAGAAPAGGKGPAPLGRDAAEEEVGGAVAAALRKYEGRRTKKEAKLEACASSTGQEAAE